MKILAIIGSPKTNGNTYRTVNQIERELNEKNDERTFWTALLTAAIDQISMEKKQW
ncbi:hypothetical protein [Paenibacillus sabinae]|uniref:NADPH-dependent FMN reductase-like domain-containing protein n=1 Tax=Paenibacillus sabinae T27 TaxID=1268072 RepID=X4ZG76_9BACL|nr:hypothetical protein [Paenibacillus sabinae]AHV95730.1 hypothetical protein PSAB_03970 [Paenibacillus sabinae T27]